MKKQIQDLLAAVEARNQSTPTTHGVLLAHKLASCINIEEEVQAELAKAAEAKARAAQPAGK